MLLESKVLLSSNFFQTNLLSFLEIQTLIKSHSLMSGASNLAILIFSHAFFISGILKVAAHNFMISRSCDGLAARGLLVDGQLTLTHRSTFQSPVHHLSTKMLIKC